MYRNLLLILIIPLFSLTLQSCQPQTRAEKATVVPNNSSINSQVGRLFLAKNKLVLGVHTLPSGLQFVVIQNGLGDHPKLIDLVTVYYQGEYIDGRVFDDQHAQKIPVTIRVSAVIPAWQEALQLMEPGSIWAIYAPPQLAYGEKGIPRLVGPNQTLVYYIHLLKISHS